MRVANRPLAFILAAALLACSVVAVSTNGLAFTAGRRIR